MQQVQIPGHEAETEGNIPQSQPPDRTKGEFWNINTVKITNRLCLDNSNAYKPHIRPDRTSRLSYETIVENSLETAKIRPGM